MEIIRRDTDYAIRALLHLALAPEEAISCAELAEASAIPKSFAYKILKKMAKAGIVASRSGRAGGFRLNKSPKRIFLREVVETVQGPVTVSRCVLDPTACARSDDCPVSVEWGRLQDGIVRFLKQTTLQDLLRSLASEKGARGRTK